MDRTVQMVVDIQIKKIWKKNVDNLIDLWYYEL